MSSDQVTATVVEARKRLQGHFRKYSGDHYGEGWERLWAKGDFLPWDKGFPNPALIDTLREHQSIIGNAVVEAKGEVRRKRALVPGCGRGVDVLLLKSFGYEAIGLEYSETAVHACRRFQEAHGGEYEIYDLRLGEGTARFVCGDFFQDDWLAGIAGSEGGFELIYDYTESHRSPRNPLANLTPSSSSALWTLPFDQNGPNASINYSVLHHIATSSA